MGFFNFFKKKDKKNENIQKIDFRMVLDENEINEILSNEIKFFFPKSGDWYYNCFGRPEELKEENLPCHLRDNEWMSRLLKNKLLFENINIHSREIKKFIDKSKDFEILRHDYELEIVRWQISWMRNGGGNWIAPKEFDGEELDFCYEPDKMFRGGVLQTLTAIGMDKEVIEEGLEKFADMWRDFYIDLSFMNYYSGISYLGQPKKPADEQHRQNWIKLRNYEYYIEHKDSVDKFGKLNEGMTLSKEMAEKLAKIVAVQNAEREKYLKEEVEEGFDFEYYKGLFED